MTLTELMVYCVLLSLFGVMVFISLPSRPNATAENLREATARADHALRLLTHELGNASQTSVTSWSSPPGVVFLVASPDGYSPFTYLTNGEISWLGWVGYIFQGGQLERVWYPFKKGVPRSTISGAPLASELLATGQRQVLCQKVSAFKISTPEPNLWQFDMQLSIDGNEIALTSGAGARN